AASERGVLPGWTAAQIHYDKPEVKAEAPPPVPAPPPPPVETPNPQDAMLAKLRAMQAELDALKQRKALPGVAAPVPVQPAGAMAGTRLFVSHDVHDQPTPPRTPEYVLAPGATKLPCVLETAINSDVEGYLTCRVSTNVYDTATGRHLLIPQGST